MVVINFVDDSFVSNNFFFKFDILFFILHVGITTAALALQRALWHYDGRFGIAACTLALRNVFDVAQRVLSLDAVRMRCVSFPSDGLIITFRRSASYYQFFKLRFLFRGALSGSASAKYIILK